MSTLFKNAAQALGWQWSPAHNGYIHESRRGNGTGRDSYDVAPDAEQACWLDGVKNETEAKKAITERPAF